MREQKSRYSKRRGQLEVCATACRRKPKLDSKRNEHDLLKSLIDSMEGYPESVNSSQKS